MDEREQDRSYAGREGGEGKADELESTELADDA
jgi:hypothetical protein